MMRPVAITLGLLIAATAVMYSTAPDEGDVFRPDPEELAKVVAEIEGLDALRSGLAGAFSDEPDMATSARVCEPVGARAKKLAEENGWQIRQLALKYRNPKARPDPEAELVYRMMDDTPEIMGLWVRTKVDGVPGFRYYRRIVVEPACLACHGAKASRPQFVKDGYPEDRAYNFEAGELRGLYSVFVPDAE